MASPTIPPTYITTHNSSGLSTFLTATLKPKPKPLNAHVAILYSTTASPINFSDAADITEHENSPEPPRLIPKTGVNTLICEWPPGGSDTKASPMHRTLSLDIGVMIAGSVELILDSGEAKVLKTGDVLIHRGTMHSWRNTSDTETARMVIVVLPSEDITVGGKAVEGKPVG